MIKYIEPNLRKFDTFDELDEDAESKFPFMSSKNRIAMEKLFTYQHALILGEPEMGKTRLLQEMTFHANDIGQNVMYIVDVGL